MTGKCVTLWDDELQIVEDAGDFGVSQPIRKRVELGFPTGHPPALQDPHSPGALNNLAVAEYRQGRMHAAIAPWISKLSPSGSTYKKPGENQWENQWFYPKLLLNGTVLLPMLKVFRIRGVHFFFPPGSSVAGPFFVDFVSWVEDHCML